MADDYYSGNDNSETLPVAERGGDGDESTDSNALLPVSFFEGKELEPGKRCEIEIVHVYDDEVEVKYVPHEGGDESSEKRSTMEQAEDELGAMAKEE